MHRIVIRSYHRRQLTEEQQMTMGAYLETVNTTPPTMRPKPQRMMTSPVRTMPITQKLPAMPIMTAKSIVLALVVVGSVAMFVYFYLKVFGERDKQRLSKTASQIGRNALSDEGM